MVNYAVTKTVSTFQPAFLVNLYYKFHHNPNNPVELHLRIQTVKIKIWRSHTYQNKDKDTTLVSRCMSIKKYVHTQKAQTCVLMKALSKIDIYRLNMASFWSEQWFVDAMEIVKLKSNSYLSNGTYTIIRMIISHSLWSREKSHFLHIFHVTHKWNTKKKKVERYML